MSLEELGDFVVSHREPNAAGFVGAAEADGTVLAADHTTSGSPDQTRRRYRSLRRHTNSFGGDTAIVAPVAVYIAASVGKDGGHSPIDSEVGYVVVKARYSTWVDKPEIY